MFKMRIFPRLANGRYRDCTWIRIILCLFDLHKHCRVRQSPSLIAAKAACQSHGSEATTQQAAASTDGPAQVQHSKHLRRHVSKGYHCVGAANLQSLASCFTKCRLRRRYFLSQPHGSKRTRCSKWFRGATHSMALQPSPDEPLD